MKSRNLTLVCIKIFLILYTFFHLSFMFTVNFIYLHVLCSCTMHSETNAMTSLWQSFLLCFLYLLSTANALKLCTTWTLYFMKPCVFWYHNLLTTHSSANILIQCQPGPERAKWGRCNLVLHETGVFTNDMATLMYLSK
jgi:hypothetical protein